MSYKVGIITHWWSIHNYGQKLQTYALQSFLQKYDCKCILLRYRYDNHWWRLYLLNRQIQLYTSLLLGKFIRKKNYSFREFNLFARKFLHESKPLSSFASFSDYCHKFDLLITGSDQVWASSLFFKHEVMNYNTLNAFTLFFDSPAKKISYAASDGGYRFCKELQSIFLYRIKELEAISVRETALHEYLQENGVQNILVPDPVLLLSKKDYINLIGSKHLDPKFHKKCFHYGLNNKSVLSSTEIAQFLSNKLGPSYTFVDGTDDKYPVPQTDFPTIEEWLSYIMNSNIVITNSYHCVVFSIIFQTNFYYVPLLPKDTGLCDNRITTLLDIVGINDRAVTSMEDLKKVIETPMTISWGGVQDKLSKFADDGKNYLLSIINTIKKHDRECNSFCGHSLLARWKKGNNL